MEAGPVSGAVVGRFAPSPSGRLHLGNLACSLLAWLSAKNQGGRIVLRIEDLDAERCPRIYADLLEQDLAWLGLVWDEGGSTGGPHGPYYQSECADIYTGQYKKLEAQGLVYPCFCSRAQLHAASAPHTSDGNVIYPGTCRDLTAAQIAEKRKKKVPAYRVRVPDEEITFWTAAWAPTRRTCCGTAATFTCAGATGCTLTSWPWWWTTPSWGHAGGARVGPAVLHGAAAVPVPSAGPAGSSLCPLPAAAGVGRAAALQAGRRPEP